jgi:hypothetical protein
LYAFFNYFYNSNSNYTITRRKRWADQIPNYLELCGEEIDEMMKAMGNVDTNYKRYFKLCLSFLAVLTGVSHIVTESGIHNFYLAFGAYKDFFLW